MASLYSLCSCSEGLKGGQLPLEPWLDGLSANSEVQNITLTVRPEVMEGYVEGVGLHEARGEPQYVGCSVALVVLAETCQMERKCSFIHSDWRKQTVSLRYTGEICSLLESK